ncbi:unnamed protein product, partial [Allacma fusca]
MEPVWEFNKIIAERTEEGNKQYLVDWCPTWTNANELSNLQTAIDEYHGEGEVPTSNIPAPTVLDVSRERSID